jgi:hypothetical protein
LELREAVEVPLPVEEHRLRLAEAERAAYERGVADGIRETAESHVARAREHLREAVAHLGKLTTDISERERDRDAAVDRALATLAERLAWGDDRLMLHRLFGRHLSAFVSRLRAAELRRLSISKPALTYLQDEFPEFLSSLRNAGVAIEDGKGSATAVLERADGELTEIDFDALAGEIRAALNDRDETAGEGDLHERPDRS